MRLSSIPAASTTTFQVTLSNQRLLPRPQFTGGFSFFPRYHAGCIYMAEVAWLAGRALPFLLQQQFPGRGEEKCSRTGVREVRRVQSLRLDGIWRFAIDAILEHGWQATAAGVCYPTNHGFRTASPNPCTQEAVAVPSSTG